MTTSTIDSAKVYLLPGRFGTPEPNFGPLLGGVLGSSHHNVSASAFRRGTVIRLYQDGTALTSDGEAGGAKGYVEFAYLQFQAASTAIAAKTICVMESTGDWGSVTNDVNACANSSGIAPMGCVALSAVTDGYFAWAQTGGPIALSYVSALSGNFATSSAVTAGNVVAASNASASKFVFDICNADTEVIIGYASESDA